MRRRAVTAAARVMGAAMEQGQQTPTTLALALDSAQLLMSPEKAAELIALRNDALNMRGALSPNGSPRRVPMPLGKELAPVVEWLLSRVDELENDVRRLNTQRGDVALLIERERQHGEECVDIGDLEAALSIGSDETFEAGEPDEWCTGCNTDHDPDECGYRPVAGGAS